MATIEARVARFLREKAEKGDHPTAEEISELFKPRKRGRKRKQMIFGRRPMERKKVLIGREYQALLDGSSRRNAKGISRVAAIYRLEKKYHKSERYFDGCLSIYREAFAVLGHTGIRLFLEEIGIYEAYIKPMEEERKANTAIVKNKAIKYKGLGRLLFLER